MQDRAIIYTARGQPLGKKKSEQAGHGGAALQENAARPDLHVKQQKQWPNGTGGPQDHAAGSGRRERMGLQQHAGQRGCHLDGCMQMEAQVGQLGQDPEPGARHADAKCEAEPLEQHLPQLPAPQPTPWGMLLPLWPPRSLRSTGPPARGEQPSRQLHPQQDGPKNSIEEHVQPRSRSPLTFARGAAGSKPLPAPALAHSARGAGAPGAG